MKDKLKKLQDAFLSELKKVDALDVLDTLEQDFFGRKSGKMSMIMKEMKELSDDVRKEVGKAANDIKQIMVGGLADKKKELEHQKWDEVAKTEAIDVTQHMPQAAGHIHPITKMQYEVEDFFASMGFLIADGPELESDYYNFESVNIPKTHPARDMQDTFYIKDHSNWVMRTHTSSVQVRAMQEHGFPLRMIAPGRCFRNEATDVRHEHTFYQIEGVVVDKNINFSHMKGVLEAFAKHLYGPETQVRLRPKFYPFVEPGVNGEVTCYLCAGQGCRLCKKTGWLEVFGAGMIHPNVLKEGGADPNEYQGFAFGFGLNRLVMLKHNVEDIRLFQSGDVRFLEQF
jgi:phenylalanyl-tRNA synthetase alpha chain